MTTDRLIVEVQRKQAGTLTKTERGFEFAYRMGYDGPPVSLTLPVREQPYRFDSFPSFFDGLLPEGVGLEGLLRTRKLDRNDWMGQLLAVGGDVPGFVTLRASKQGEP